MADSDTLRSLWQSTLGADPGDGWATLSGGATYRASEEVGGTLSGGSTVGGMLSGGATISGTLSGGTTVGGAEGISTSRIGLGGFHLIEEIGRGGMGVVWRARQDSLARDVAVKLIRSEASNERSRRGFVSEALVNGVLDHPNIVPVHELGTTPEGEAFLAMKLVGGTAWNHLLHPRNAAEQERAKGYDTDRHLGVLEAVANAVAFAHSRGIVHRDLKPENVMVGEYGEVLVMDWGIAVDIRERPDPTDSRATHKSDVRSPAGTPNYMAPELAEGRGGDIGPWTDVYLLGAILCEILRGTPPHQGNSLMAILLAASRSDAPAFPAGTPAGLITICHKALSRDHRARYASVPALQAALAEYRKHRESDVVASAAQGALDRCASRDAAKLSGAERAALYGDYAEAVAGFRQALSLWSENVSATSGEASARRGYASAALAAGDLALAEAQAAPLQDSDLNSRISAATRARQARESAAKRNRFLLIGSAAVIVIGLTLGVLMVNAQRSRAVNAEQEAVTAQKEAIKQRDAAEAQGIKVQTALAQAIEDEGLRLASDGLGQEALAKLWEAMAAAPANRRQSIWQHWQMVALGAADVTVQMQAPCPFPTEQESYYQQTAFGTDDRAISAWSKWDEKTNITHTSLTLWKPSDGSIQKSITLPEGTKCLGLVWGASGIVALLKGEDGPVLLSLKAEDLSERWQKTFPFMFMNDVVACRVGLDTVLMQVGGFAARYDIADGRMLQTWDAVDFDSAMKDTDNEGWILPIPETEWVAERADRDPERVFRLEAYRPELKTFATGYRQSVLRLRKIQGDEEVLIRSDEGELFAQVRPGPGGRRIYALGDQVGSQRLLAYDTATGDRVAVMAMDVSLDERIHEITADGNGVLLANAAGELRLVSLPGAPQVVTRPWPAGLGQSSIIKMSEDGNGLLVLFENGDLADVDLNGSERWRVATGLPADAYLGITMDNRILGFTDGEGFTLRKAIDGTAIAKAIQWENDGDNEPIGDPVSWFVSEDYSSVLLEGEMVGPLGWVSLVTGKWLPSQADFPETVEHSQGYEWVSLAAIGSHHVVQINRNTSMGAGDSSLLIDHANHSLRDIGPMGSGVSADGDPIAVLADAGGLSIWDLGAGRRLYSLGSPGQKPITIDKEGCYLLSADEKLLEVSIDPSRVDGNWALWDVKRRRRIATFMAPIIVNGETPDAGPQPLFSYGVNACLLPKQGVLRQLSPTGIVEVTFAVLPLPDDGAFASATIPQRYQADFGIQRLRERIASRSAQELTGHIDQMMYQLDHRSISPVGLKRSAKHAIADLPIAERTSAHREALAALDAAVAAQAVVMDPDAPPPPPVREEGVHIKIERAAEGWWCQRYGGSARWWWIPPGVHPLSDGNEVEITQGFWIYDSPLETRNGAWDLEENALDNAGLPNVDRNHAIQFADLSKKARLPSAAEMYVAVARLGKLLPLKDSVWTADSWQPVKGRRDCDPWKGVRWPSATGTNQSVDAGLSFEGSDLGVFYRQRDTGIPQVSPGGTVAHLMLIITVN